MHRFKTVKKSKLDSGFTLIEILLVMAIFAVLSSFITINLIRPQEKIGLDSATITAVADLKGQQQKAMSQDSEGTLNAQTFGVYFEPQKYFLFRGLNYIPSDPANFENKLDPLISISTNLPSNQIVFTRRSGEVSNFNPSQNTITIVNTQSGESKTLTINLLGAISIN